MTNSKARRPLLFVFLGVVTLIASAALGLRTKRGSFTPPIELGAGLWASRVGGGVSVFLAEAGPGAVLFDTGMDPELHGIDALLKAAKRSRADVHDILLTHGHSDHVAGVAAFPGARVYAGADDVELAAGRAKAESLLPRLFGLVWAAPAATVTHPLRGTETIILPDHKSVLAIPVPGHTAGSYAYVYERVLFPGDIIILEAGHLAQTPKPFNPHPAENLASIRALGKALAGVPVDRVCTAHGGCTVAGQGRPALDELLAGLPPAAP